MDNPLSNTWNSRRGYFGTRFRACSLGYSLVLESHFLRKPIAYRVINLMITMCNA